jgi:single-strand DNA-binding protein
MNKATLIGRLAADPELRQTGSGIAVTSFTIAVDRPYTKGSDRQTDWIDIVAWRNTAEFVCKYFQKGSPIIIEGSIQTRMWEDKAGQKRKSVEIVAENVEFPPRARTEGKTENESIADDTEDFTEMEDLPWEN